jgi:hypothetical protein
MLFSGIDLHERSLVIHTLDADGARSTSPPLLSSR